jgi:hypothetical protein
VKRVACSKAIDILKSLGKEHFEIYMGINGGKNEDFRGIEYELNWLIQV